MIGLAFREQQHHEISSVRTLVQHQWQVCIRHSLYIPVPMGFSMAPVTSLGFVHHAGRPLPMSVVEECLGEYPLIFCWRSRYGLAFSFVRISTIITERS